MTITDLQKKLEEAYSIGNLNNISLTLINLYKNEQFSILQIDKVLPAVVIHIPQLPMHIAIFQRFRKF